MIKDTTVALVCVPNRDRWRSVVADDVRHMALDDDEETIGMGSIRVHVVPSRKQLPG